MGQLDILWGLQHIDSEINTIKGDKRIKEMQKRLVEIKGQYDSIKSTIEQQLKEKAQNKAGIACLNDELNGIDLKLKTDSTRLYQKGQSLKAIDNLQKEMDTYKTRKDETENKLIKLLESEEKLGGAIKDMEKSIAVLRDEFNDIKARYDESKMNTAQKLKVLDEQREDVIKKLDADILEKYTAIACKKLAAVSKVVEGTCHECGGKLNAILYDTVKKKNSMCLCEHCGRILYYG